MPQQVHLSQWQDSQQVSLGILMHSPAGHSESPNDCDAASACFIATERVSPELLLHAQFLAWDTFARRRVDMIGRKDKGDTVIAHEFDYKIEKQVHNTLLKHVNSPLAVALISQCTVQRATQSSILQPVYPT